LNHIARNHVRSGVRVSWNTVPTVSAVSAVHISTPRAVTHGASTTPQRWHTNPSRQRNRRM
jgi:hypothetical protein